MALREGAALRHVRLEIEQATVVVELGAEQRVNGVTVASAGDSVRQLVGTGMAPGLALLAAPPDQTAQGLAVIGNVSLRLAGGCPSR